MAIKGSLREASLPDVLQLLALGQKSGCLAVTDRSSFGYIYFERGNICYASIVNRRDRLGDLLVKNGLIGSDVLAQAIEAQGSFKAKRLGEILVERGAITPEQLEHYIRVQIEEAVYFLFTWTQGSFYFEVDQRPEEGAMLITINPESLLLEGARRVDEWSLIEKKIPSFDMVFSLDPQIQSVPADELASEQRKIIPLLDGERSVRDVIEESGLVEFDVGKALFGLIQAGLAHPRGRKAARVPTDVPAGKVQEHRNLGIAFYRTGMFEEAVREFRRVLELDPKDREAGFFLGLTALRGGDARQAIREFKGLLEAGGLGGAAFHNLSLALEQIGRPEDALLALEEALRSETPAPRALLSRAILLLKAQRPADAAEAFDSYREALGTETPPPAAYYAFAVLAEAACGRLDDALALGQEGLGLHPASAPLLLHVGSVRERAGAWEEAEQLYRRATEEGGHLPQTHKSLGDALYRRGNYAEAAEPYRRALSIAPNLGDDVYFKLGNIHYKQGERDEAVRLWREALRLNPNNGIARTNLELVERVIASTPG